jgi:hypothetical protein
VVLLFFIFHFFVLLDCLYYDEAWVAQ